MSKGSAPTIDPDNDKNSVVALREIAEKSARPNDLREGLIHSMQHNVEIDEPEETAAPNAPAALRPPMLGRDDPSSDTQIDVMTEEALLRAMKSLMPEEPSHAFGDKDHSRGSGRFTYGDNH